MKDQDTSHSCGATCHFLGANCKQSCLEFVRQTFLRDRGALEAEVISLAELQHDQLPHAANAVSIFSLNVEFDFSVWYPRTLRAHSKTDVFLL